MKARTIFSVSQVNRYVKKMLDSDALLAGLFIEGELSNFNAHSSGHLYFTLKDQSASINGVMFKANAGDIAFTPKSGMKVIAFGHLGLYEKTGQYQLYVEFLEPAGIGGLQLAFAQLKERLEAEGLFDISRKREIPRFPKCIAIITSPTGAAIQDIIKTIRGRNSTVKIMLSPALVQGENAAPDIVRAISEVNAYGSADIIILGRGGGSVEDLWAFNEEIVARAIASSKIPIISAVGHETDFTISDFVADLRAPTPTAAAQVAAYDQLQVLEYIKKLHDELNIGIIESIKSRFNGIETQTKNLSRRINERLANERKSLIYIEALLEKVSPYTIFKRGFALIQAENKLITSVKSISPGQSINITWTDGQASAEIKGRIIYAEKD